jgi:hypothetical protein
MTEPIDTTIRAADMTPAQRQAFLAQCRKLESASSSQSNPVERSARDMTKEEREEWLAEHKRKFR